MNEDIAQQETIDEVKSIRDSRLYTLARSTTLLRSLVPDINGLAPTEMFMDSEYPRTEEDGEDTRIFIAYRNVNKNTTMAMFKDASRLKSTFNIDSFMDDYQRILFEGSQGNIEDPIEMIEFVASAVINFSALAVIGIEDQGCVTTAVMSLGALASIIFDDPLDVFISITEIKPEGSEKHVPTLVAMWQLHARKKILQYTENTLSM